jgi:hypothetical protein
VDLLASQEEIRKAFLQKAKVLHPDRATTKEPNGEFSDLQRAYDHLIKEDGMGKQMNPAHSLKLMLEATSTDSGEGNCGEDCFKARLIAVLLEYGDKGLEVGNIKKKWKQVWPDTPFPEEPPKIKGGQQKRKGAVLEYIMKHAADSVAILASNGTTRLVPRNVTQAHVLSATDTYT